MTKFSNKISHSLRYLSLKQYYCKSIIITIELWKEQEFDIKRNRKIYVSWCFLFYVLQEKIAFLH